LNEAPNWHLQTEKKIIFKSFGFIILTLYTEHSLIYSYSLGQQFVIESSEIRTIFEAWLWFYITTAGIFQGILGNGIFCLGIFHRQKSNFGKFTLCSYSINIDVIVN